MCRVFSTNECMCHEIDNFDIAQSYNMKRQQIRCLFGLITSDNNRCRVQETSRKDQSEILRLKWFIL